MKIWRGRHKDDDLAEECDASSDSDSEYRKRLTYDSDDEFVVNDIEEGCCANADSDSELTDSDDEKGSYQLPAHIAALAAKAALDDDDDDGKASVVLM